MTDNTLCLIKMMEGPCPSNFLIKKHLRGSSVQRTFYQSKKKIYDYEVGGF